MRKHAARTGGKRVSPVHAASGPNVGTSSKLHRRSINREGIGNSVRQKLCPNARRAVVGVVK